MFACNSDTKLSTREKPGHAARTMSDLAKFPFLWPKTRSSYYHLRIQLVGWALRELIRRKLPGVPCGSVLQFTVSISLTGGVNVDWQIEYVPVL